MTCRFNVDCASSTGLYGGAEGAFGVTGSDTSDSEQCPAPRPGGQCEGAPVSNCWSPGQRDTGQSLVPLVSSINIKTAQIVPTTASAASTAVQTLVSTDQSRPHHHQLHRHPHHHQPPCQSRRRRRRRRRRRLATPTPCLSSPWSCPNPPGPQQGCPLCTGPRPCSPSLTGLSLL